MRRCKCCVLPVNVAEDSLSIGLRNNSTFIITGVTVNGFSINITEMERKLVRVATNHNLFTSVME